MPRPITLECLAVSTWGLSFDRQRNVRMIVGTAP